MWKDWDKYLDENSPASSRPYLEAAWFPPGAELLRVGLGETNGPDSTGCRCSTHVPSALTIVHPVLLCLRAPWLQEQAGLLHREGLMLVDTSPSFLPFWNMSKVCSAPGATGPLPDSASGAHEHILCGFPFLSHIIACVF